MISVAKYISAVFNPLVLPLIIFTVLAFKLETDPVVRFLVISVSLFFFSLLPLIILLWMKKHQSIESIDVRDRIARTRPFIYGILCMLAGSTMFLLLGLNHADVYQAVAMIGILNAVIAAVITTRWKISIHSMSMASSGVLLYFISGTNPLAWPPFTTSSILFILSIVFVTIFVQWSRVVLKHHTIAQVIAGALLAVILTILQLTLYFPEFSFGIFT
jgi:membrane-associated phospholipid phosphatase